MAADTLLARLARADTGATTDQVGLEPALPHFFQQPQGVLTLRALLARAGCGVANDHVVLQPARPHFLQGLKATLAFHTLLWSLGSLAQLKAGTGPDYSRLTRGSGRTARQSGSANSLVPNLTSRNGKFVVAFARCRLTIAHFPFSKLNSFPPKTPLRRRLLHSRSHNSLAAQSLPDSALPYGSTAASRLTHNFG